MVFIKTMLGALMGGEGQVLVYQFHRANRVSLLKTAQSGWNDNWKSFLYITSRWEKLKFFIQVEQVDT